MFSHYARVLASVPRWVIVPVLRRQSVAEHSYYVSLYVAELLGLSIFDNWLPERKFMAVRAALIHDAPEARMGDWPGPVKRMVKDPEKYAALENQITRDMGFVDRFGYPWHTDDQIDAVIKAADLIDEFFYIKLEVASGNGVMARLAVQVEDRLYKALGKLPWGTPPPCHSEHPDLRALFNDIQEEVIQLASGLITMSNNTDVDPAPCNCVWPDECDKCRIPF